MVAIVAGNGLGVFNASNNILGALGTLGQGGLPQTNGRSYVNAETGDLILQSTDEEVSGRAADLELLRTYNSQGSLTSALNGIGWSWDGERSVNLTSGTVNTTGSIVTRVTGDGHSAAYTWNGTKYVSKEGSGANDTLTWDSGANQWTWVDGSTRQTDVYGANGRLVSQTDVSGNKITFEYVGNLLSKITDFSSGQQIRLTYSSTTPAVLQHADTYELLVDSTTGKVTDPPTVSTTPLKVVNYSYDGSGRLKSVSTALQPGVTGSPVFVTTYAYDGTSNRISSITQNDGSTSGGTPFSVSFTYEQVPGSSPAVFRVKTVTDANGTQTFTYNSNSTDITIADSSGGNAQTWTYTFDNVTRQLASIQSPAVNGSRLTTQFQYDAAVSDNVKKVVSANGDAVIYQYDSNGNCVLQRDSAGDTIARTYDGANQLLTETHYKTADTSGLDESTIGIGSAQDPMTTHYVYDSSERLRFVISPEGRVTENRYSGGLLERTVQYTADRFAGTTFGEADLSNWVTSLADKSQIELTQYTYDFRGNLNQRTSFANADANGAGILDAGATVTQYVYDGHGQLIHTIAVHGDTRNQSAQLVSVAYDGLGREIARTDSNGSQTISYDDKSSTVTIVTGAGQRILSTYNGIGELTSVSRSDTNSTSTPSRVTQYTYDAQGRLKSTVDSQGSSHFNYYDAAGRLQSTVDSAGAVVGYTYSGSGQVLTQTHYGNPATGISSAGYTLVPSTTLDRTTSYTYDSAGRLKTQTDAAGTVTTMSYDGDSRLTAQQTAATSGSRTTQYFYDADGNRVGLVDALGYLTESKYDAAGRLVRPHGMQHAVWLSRIVPGLCGSAFPIRARSSGNSFSITCQPRTWMAMHSRIPLWARSHRGCISTQRLPL